MRILLSLAVAGSLASPDCVWAAQKENSPKTPVVSEYDVVARVNGEPVTRSELQRMLAGPLMQSLLEQEPGVHEPDSKESDRVALRTLIHRRLILQEARRRNLTVSEQDVDKAVTALRRRFEDLEDFGAWMKEQGLDDKNLFETLRTEILTARLLAALVEDVRLTGEQVREYYEAHKDGLAIGEEVRLRIIVVKDKAAAEEIMGALQKGENFGRLARKRSLGLRAAQGGDTGWIDSRTFSPPLRQTVAVLKAGEVVGPLQKGADEFLIVGLEGRRPLRAKSMAEARPEIERRLLSAKHQEGIQAWLSEQEKISKIEIFTRSK